MIDEKGGRQLQSAFFAKVATPIPLTALFDHLRDVHFYAKNQAGTFVAVNQASVHRHGFTSPWQVVGCTDFDLHPPQMAAAYVAEDQRVMEGRTALPERVWLVYDHLKIQRWFISTKVPLFDAGGAVIGIAGAMQPLDSLPASAPAFSSLQPAIDRVLGGYGEKVSVSELAGAVGLSISQFDRRFRKTFGMTPSQYIGRVRVNAARHQLSHGDRPVGEIAHTCGFYDQAQLARAFKAHTGMTPTAYRDRFRSRAVPGGG